MLELLINKILSCGVYDLAKAVERLQPNFDQVSSADDVRRTHT